MQIKISDENFDIFETFDWDVNSDFDEYFN